MGKDQRAAPFWEAVLRQARAGGQIFYTPGHKRGRTGDASWRGLLQEALALDLDPPALPSPSAPESAVAPSVVVREAEELLARLYGARRSFFLVNGATGGLQALLLATVAGGALLLPRNAHRSVLGALALADARPVYLPGSVDPFWGLPLAPRLPSPPRFPAVQAVLATYPDYYGLACDLAGWRETLTAGARHLHPAGDEPLPLLVDEAHGPHLPFLPSRPADGFPLPRPALELGADAVVQSPHKLLGSLVQSAWLHLAGERPGGRYAVEARRVEAALVTLTTTSPSFLLLSSLDATRRWAAEEGREAYRRLTELAGEARERINALPGLRCLDDQEARRLGYVALDPTKLTVSVRELGLSGPEAEAFLRWRGLHAELADPLNLLFILSPADPPETISALVEGLAALARAAGRAADRARLTADRSPGAAGPAETAALFSRVLALPPERAVTPREALLAPALPVSLGQAAGRVAARAVGVYPPGIPVVSPGEILTPAHVELLQRLIAGGLRVEGLADEDRVEVVEG
ncbi:MAG: aminotransferase class I/II-fold pyridoxal phosphate-dependent enzyme [Betaproteobacteria bacterium]